MLFVEGLPVEFLEIHVVAEIHAEISFGRDGPARVLEFFFVHVDGDFGVDEMLQSTRVVQMQMANHHRLHVLNVIAGGFDRGREFVLVVVCRAGEDVGDGGAPLDVDIFGAARLKEYQAGSGVVDETSDEGEVAALIGWVGFGLGAAVGAAEEPVGSC